MTTADPDLERLIADGFLTSMPEGLRTTSRWQAAMMRASARLVRDEEGPADLRLPVAMALIEAYGHELPDATIVRLVELIVPIEARELDPRGFELQGS